MDSFNIIDILSVANKELTHSSIIKFFIEEKVNEVLDFFEIKDTNICCCLEVSDSYKFQNEKSKIRFDIVLKGLDKKPIAIIENKFKATPTIKQLESYDQYFSEKKYEGKKILMVFCKEQIPSNVKTYCESHDWTLKFYFNFRDKEISLYQAITSNPSIFINQEKTILFNHYKKYLEHYYTSVGQLLDPIIPFSDNYDREFFSKYLMVLQGDISNKIKNTLGDESAKIVADNDGGSNPVPSVAFWFSFNNSRYNYIAIDGYRLKLGFSYKRNDTYSSIETYLNIIIIELEKNEFIKNNFGKRVNRKLKSGMGTSVISLYSFDLRDWPKDKIASIASDLLILYYTLTKEINAKF